MDEIKFVLKALILTSVLLMALQFEVQGKPVETQVSEFVRSGPVMVWLRESIKGGEKLAQRGISSVSQKWSSGHWFSEESEKPAKKQKPSMSSDVPAGEFPEEDITTVDLKDHADF